MRRDRSGIFQLRIDGMFFMSRTHARAVVVERISRRNTCNCANFARASRGRTRPTSPLERRHRPHALHVARIDNARCDPDDVTRPRVARIRLDASRCRAWCRRHAVGNRHFDRDVSIFQRGTSNQKARIHCRCDGMRTAGNPKVAADGNGRPKQKATGIFRSRWPPVTPRR